MPRWPADKLKVQAGFARITKDIDERAAVGCFGPHHIFQFLGYTRSRVDIRSTRGTRCLVGRAAIRTTHSDKEQRHSIVPHAVVMHSSGDFADNRAGLQGIHSIPILNRPCASQKRSLEHRDIAFRRVSVGGAPIVEWASQERDINSPRF